MRLRLRPAYPAEKLADLYGQRYDHTRWHDHIVRVGVTVELVRKLCPAPVSVADLSCGDGAIARELAAPTTILGDLTPGHYLCGPIEETVGLLPARVDLFILSETLEHLDDPDLVLRRIRAMARTLALSTPDGEITAANPEHYWGWTADDVKDMLCTAGWTPTIYEDLHVAATGTRYQLWGCQ